MAVVQARLPRLLLEYEVQGVEDLEVAGDAAEEIGTGGSGESPAGPLLGEVEDLALVGEADQALEAEGAAEHVLGEALEAGDVVGFEPHREVDIEA